MLLQHVGNVCEDVIILTIELVWQALLTVELFCYLAAILDLISVLLAIEASRVECKVFVKV